MSKGVATNAGTVTAGPAVKTPKTGAATDVPAMIASVVTITIAAFAALMFGLFHELGWQECALIVIGAALLAGGITYTFQRFRSSREEGSRKGGTV